MTDFCNCLNRISKGKSMGIAFDKSRKPPEERVLREQVPMTSILGTIVFLMTNDYTVIVRRLKGLLCRPPLPWEFSPRPYMPYEFMEKMKSLGATWALLVNANDSGLYYYDETTEHPFQVDLTVLSLDRKELSAEKMRLCIIDDNTKGIEELVKSGYDIKQILYNDVTPLNSAVVFNSYKAAKLLLKLGADVNARAPDRSYTPLMDAVTTNSIESAKVLLADKNIDLEARNLSGDTALIMAVFEGNMEMVRLLVKAGADINVTDNFRSTALIISIGKKHDDISKFLIDSGADVNFQGDKNITAFILSALTGNASIAEKLLKAGADCNAKDETGRTALTYAIYGDFADYVEWYLKNIKLSRADYVVALFHCAEAGSCQAASVLLRSTQSIEDAASFLLAFAAISDNANIISACMDNGCDINKKSSFGMTALMIACYAGAEVFADTLIALGADLNIADDYGMTALMYAASKNDIRLAGLLLENGADTHMKDKQEKSFADYFMELDDRSYAEGCRDRILSISSSIFGNQDSQQQIPSVKQTFNERFDCYMQKYFERFPDKKAADIYKDGDISKKTFSKIQSNRDPDYRPQKDMVLSLALGLKLSAQEAGNLVKSAGYAFSDPDKEDFEIKRVIANRDYNSFDWSRRLYEETGLIFFRRITDSLQVKAPALEVDTEKKSSDKIILEEKILQDSDEFLPEKMRCLIIGNNATGIEELVKSGFDLEQDISHGLTALDIAVFADAPESLRTLLRLGADINRRDSLGMCPLMNAAFKNLIEPAKILIADKNIDLEAKDVTGTTALSWASYSGSVEVMKLLIEAGADINSTDERSCTPLMASLYREKYDAAELLIDSGADVNLSGKDGLTPLIRMAAGDKTEITEKLLKAGADINAKDKLGDTAFHTAIIYDAGKFLNVYLKNTDVNSFEFNQAIKNCAEGGKYHALSALLESSKTPNEDASSALQYAAEYNHVDTIPVCMRYDCDINMQSIFGMTALMKACFSESVEFARRLVELGADLNITDDYGMTALMYAASKNNFDLENVLLENGADRDIKDKKGKTFEDYSRKFDPRSFEELEGDRSKSSYNKLSKFFARLGPESLRTSTTPLASQTFAESFDWYRQKYFGRFPDKNDADIYKDGGISKKTYSKILNNRKPDYRPKKDTALLLVLGLRLSLSEAEDFLQNAGYKLSDKDEVDAVVKELLAEGNHDKFDWSQRIYEKTGRTFFKSEGM